MQTLTLRAYSERRGFPSALLRATAGVFLLLSGCAVDGSPYSKTETDSVGKADAAGDAIAIPKDAGVVIETYSVPKPDSPSWSDFTIANNTFPFDTELVVLTLSGGTGDGDLFARFGAEPSMSSLLDDCISLNIGNDDECVIEAQPGEDLYIVVYAFEPVLDATLTVRAIRSADLNPPTSCEFQLPPQPASSFSSAKSKLERSVFDREEDRVTFYCGCTYTEGKDVDHASCDYEKNSSRADRIEWEHKIPANRMQALPDGSLRACASVATAAEVCFKDSGFIGPRDCCQKSDAEFLMMHNDMHNLVPAVGEINGIRSNHPYGIIEGEERRFGACDFEDNGDVAEPSEEVRGDVARTYLYYDATYAGFALTAEEREMFTAWDSLDPVSERELTIATRVAQVQGYTNPFVEQGFNGVHCVAP